MKQGIPILKGVQHPWLGFTLALVVFLALRLVLGPPALPEEAGAYGLDCAYVEDLRTTGEYGLLNGNPQPYGERSLTRFALFAAAAMTGDTARAGVWCSTLALFAVLAAMARIVRRIFPCQGFQLASLCAIATSASLQGHWGADPTVMLGMAFLMLGLMFFLDCLDGKGVESALASSFFFGLAGWLYLPVVLLWALSALFLIGVRWIQAGPERSLSLSIGQAWAGLALLAIVLWPMMSRNAGIAGTLVLPLDGASFILGAPPPALTALEAVRDGNGFSETWSGLTEGPGAVGLFVVLLAPLGLAFIMIEHRQSLSSAAFWPYLVLGWFLVLAVMRPAFGADSFKDIVRISSPLLIPVAVMVPSYAWYRFLQLGERQQVRLAGWAGILLLCMFMGIVPQWGNGAMTADEDAVAASESLVDVLGKEPYIDLAILSDDPGRLVAYGKAGVTGMGGETDFRITSAKYSNGSWNWSELFDYLKANRIGLLHLSLGENEALDDMLALADGAPELTPVPGLLPGQRVFRLHWHEPL